MNVIMISNKMNKEIYDIKKVFISTAPELFGSQKSEISHIVEKGKS